MKTKIKVLLQEAVYEEKEVNFPFYRVQQNLFYYYGINEDTVICVSINKNFPQISKNILVVNNVFHLDSKEITKKEFDEKFEEAKEMLNNLIK